jgi:hypothetical protein
MSLMIIPVKKASLATTATSLLLSWSSSAIYHLLAGIFCPAG